jgi:Spy/CpxP family protein refolding chaperone
MRIQFVARLSLVVVLSLFLSAAALARPPFGGPPGPPGPEGLIEEYADRLGLDDEARAAIRAIVDASHERAAGLHQDHREARRALRDLLSQDSPDEASVMQQAELLGAIETEMTKHRLGTLLRIHALLTPEQREEMMAIHRGHGKHHGGPKMLLERIIENCDGDLETLCPDADSPFDHMGCLHDHADRVSEGCASALETLRHKRGFRRGPFRY